jgi:hypothetical protein
MEQIQDHPIQDVWRVKSGLLVVINKYESIGSWLSGKTKTKVIRGCKNLKELKEDYTDSYYKTTYPKGTLLLGSTPVKAITGVRDFRVEVKSSGGTIEGGIGDIQDVMNDIDIILAKYLFEGGK